MMLLPVRIGGHRASMIQAGVALAAVSRGVDYVVLPDSVEVDNMSVVEAALGFDAWGLFFAFAGVLVLVGMVTPRWPVAGIAHGVLVGLYTAFGVGGLATIVAQGHPYGWRTGVEWIIGTAVLHAVLADASLDAYRRLHG